MEKLINLTGNVAYVSGGASGIGATIAEVFAEQGASVVVGDVQTARGEETAARIRERGGKAFFVSHDTTEEVQWEAAFATTLEQFGRLDIVVNNAASILTCLLENVMLKDVQRLLAVNVTGTILGHKHAIRVMRPGGRAGNGGSIINLSSVAGLIGTPALSVYSASKGAVRLLTKTAAVECGRLGYRIRVNSIHPGLVSTDSSSTFVDDLVQLGMFNDRAAAEQQMLAAYPIGRIGTPQDVAHTALYLASDLSSWVTGAELVVDGGMTVN